MRLVMNDKPEKFKLKVERMPYMMSLHKEAIWRGHEQNTKTEPLNVFFKYVPIIQTLIIYS